MAKRYGVPYGMSKNRIARRLIDFLPPADVFVDLFAGGCAVAHAALESRKYNHVIINDINPLPTQLFVDAVAGKYRDERRVIDRETFHRLKNVDPYVKYCWSFSCGGFTYIWGEDIEPVKLAACKMILWDGDEQKAARKEFQNLTGGKVSDDLLDCILFEDDRTTRRMKYMRQISKIRGLENVSRLESLESLKRLEAVNSLQNTTVLDKITRLALDYKAVEIPKNAVVYCDIPYKNVEAPTRMGCGDFDENEFCEWAQGKQNVFVSSYELPEKYFEGIRGWNKRSTMSQFDKTQKVLEKIFVPKVA